MSVQKRLQKTFIQALGLAPGVDVSEFSYNHNPEWDSVAHMRLVAAVETEFGILLTTDEILDFSSFQQGMESLKQHGITD